MCSILFPLTCLFCSFLYTFFLFLELSFLLFTSQWLGKSALTLGTYYISGSGFQVLKWIHRAQEICFRWWLSLSCCGFFHSACVQSELCECIKLSVDVERWPHRQTKSSAQHCFTKQKLNPSHSWTNEKQYHTFLCICLGTSISSLS